MSHYDQNPKPRDLKAQERLEKKRKEGFDRVRHGIKPRKRKKAKPDKFEHAWKAAGVLHAACLDAIDGDAEHHLLVLQELSDLALAYMERVKAWQRKQELIGVPHDPRYTDQ